MEAPIKDENGAAAGIPEGDGIVAGTDPATEAAPAEEAYRARLRKILTCMPLEALVDILSLMGSRYQPVFDEIYRVANSDAGMRRLFVRGLAWETSAEGLKRAFSEHGEVEDAVVISDKATGKSRGFGFITYASVDAAVAALDKQSRPLDGRVVHVNLASARDRDEHGGHGDPRGGPPDMRGMGMGEYRRPGPPQPMPHGGGYGGGGGYPSMHAAPGAAPSVGGGGGTPADKAYRRFFVRGLAWETTDATLRYVCTPYGEVEEAVVIMDKTTGKSRGYGFITMRWLEGAQALMARPPSNIDGRTVEVTLASAKEGGGGGGMSHGGGGPPRGPPMGGGWGGPPAHHGGGFPMGGMPGGYGGGGMPGAYGWGGGGGYGGGMDPSGAPPGHYGGRT